MKELNLCEILKGHEGETFWCDLYGNVKLKNINSGVREVIFEHPGVDYYLEVQSNGKFTEEGELAIFPSKDQRSWHKWIKEYKKTPKIWSEIEDFINDTTIALGELSNSFSKNTKNKAIKSIVAFLKINNLIDVGYGGNITNEEWLDGNISKYFIHITCPSNYYYDGTLHFGIKRTTNQFGIESKTPIAFHTVNQAEEFLKYPENIQLLKDYFMI